MLVSTSKGYRVSRQRVVSLLLTVTVSLPCATVAAAQDVQSATLQFAASASVVDQALEENRLFVDQAVQESRQSLDNLMLLGNQAGPVSGQDAGFLGERFTQIRESQAQFIEEYASLMRLRTEALFDHLEDRNEDISINFLQTGSLYDGPQVEFPDLVQVDPIFIVPQPVFFPGFVTPLGGFFAQIDTQP